MARVGAHHPRAIALGKARILLRLGHGGNCKVTMMTRLIDVMHLGRDRVIGAYDLDGVVVDPGPASSVETLLQHVRPRVLLLTHIHRDHAGASGVLVERFPDIQVYVHEVGAPHVIDPSRLLKSAAKLYGEENMKPLWGDVLPVPEENVHVLSGGETVEGFRVEYAPGHASHHVVYLHTDSGDLFSGDACGVRIPPSELALAPTPPPDVDLDAWRGTLDKVEALDPGRICMTHFGPIDDVDAHLGRVRR